MSTTIRVALVDDQNLFREGMKLVLSTFPEITIVSESESGSLLLEQLQSGDQPDVILLDYTMPGLNGFETMQQVKAKYPTIKVILLTMHYDESLMVYMMQNGANGYLLKDETSAVVREAIQSVMKSGQYFPHYVSKALLKQLQQSGIPSIRSTADKNHNFSVREKEILAIVGKFNRQEMANQLFISIKTIDFHLKNLRDKTGTNSTAELVRYAIQQGYQN